ncbi:MAG: flavin reductase family protein [Halobacteriaceae archaeon]
MPINNEQFRAVMGQFATGVTVVTYPSDPYHGITVNAFASVSLSPPLCLICIDHETESYELLESDITGFAVNILTADQQDLGEHFANIQTLEESPFEAKQTTTKETGSPIFTESLAYLDCSLSGSHPAGDHTIYIGAIEAGDVLNPNNRPLTFYQGEWGTIQFD